jgi:hypothetical protein
LKWDYLRASAVPRKMLDGFLARPSWARLDPEHGYLLQDSAVQWPKMPEAGTAPLGHPRDFHGWFAAFGGGGAQ